MSLMTLFLCQLVSKLPISLHIALLVLQVATCVTSESRLLERTRPMAPIPLSWLWCRRTNGSHDELIHCKYQEAEFQECTVLGVNHNTLCWHFSIIPMLSDSLVHFASNILAPAQWNGFICTKPDGFSVQPETRWRATVIRRSNILHIDDMR